MPDNCLNATAPVRGGILTYVTPWVTLVTLSLLT